MSTEPFIGEIKIFGFNFNPRGYELCNGQLLAISTNTALFSLLGTYYGGNGTTTFGLPDLRGRVAKGQGQGPGLPNYIIGEMAGTPSITLTTANLPAHVHQLNGGTAGFPVSTELGTLDSPVGNFLAKAPIDMYSSAATPGKSNSLTVSGTTAVTGSSIPFNIENPYLVVNYSIATQGIFPSRN